MKKWILLLLVIVSGTAFAQTTLADSTREHGKDLMRDLFFPHWETADRGVYLGWSAGAMMDMGERYSSHFGIDMLTNIGFKYNRLWFSLGLGYIYEDWVNNTEGEHVEEHITQYVNFIPSLKYSIISREDFQLVLGVELGGDWHFRYVFYSRRTDLTVAESFFSSLRGMSIMMPVELYYSLTPTCSLFLGIDAGCCLRRTMKGIEYSGFDLYSPLVFRMGLRCKIR